MKLLFNEEEQLVVQEMNESDIQEFNLVSQGIAKMLVVKNILKSIVLHYILTYIIMK